MSLPIIVRKDGTILTIYGEVLELRSLGDIHISRASHVEPDTFGNWTADLTPIGGPVLGGFSHRSQAINQEIQWLKLWLTSSKPLTDAPQN